MQLFHPPRELGVGEGVDDLSVLHDEEPIGRSRGEAEVLLDQEDGEAVALELGDGAADLLDDDRPKPLVGSSSMRKRAPVRRIRAIASICCSPPESLPPPLESRSLRLGKSA